MNSPFEEITLNVDEGAQLNGLHFRQENPKGLILYFHGNAGNLQRWGELTEFFVVKGFDVIVMDYRGYGKSTGIRTMEALYNDADLWYDYAKEQYSENEIIVYGRSLGTGIATYVASRNDPEKVILETPFYSLTEIAKNRFPILPVESLLHYPFPSYQYINDISCPITIYHGDDDEVIDISYAKQLYDSIESEEKEFILVPGGGHNNLVMFKEYIETIDDELSIQ
jgi:alpha-beta hydrolase superfamily lysophospholipase